jgi:hypothetical protein
VAAGTHTAAGDTIVGVDALVGWAWSSAPIPMHPLVTIAAARAIPSHRIPGDRTMAAKAVGMHRLRERSTVGEGGRSRG